jgi:hypothetical protein
VGIGVAAALQSSTCTLHGRRRPRLARGEQEVAAERAEGWEGEVLAVLRDHHANRGNEIARHAHQRLIRRLEGGLVLGDRLRFRLRLVVG